MDTPAHSKEIKVDGQTVSLTHLDKVLYPEAGTTKGEVIAYYTEIAPLLIAHAHDRPVTRKRWVNGVGTAEHPAESFFQKHLDAATPDWVPRRELAHEKRTNTYPLANDAATLTWLAQTASLELHVPQWRFDAHGTPGNPDRLVLDLDPGEGVGLADCAGVASAARKILDRMGLECFPVTSGSKGIHLYARLQGAQTSDAVAEVAHELARSLEDQDGELVTSTMKRSERRGKVFVDWSQNSAAKTTVAPYSLRGRSHPFVAAPRTWRELASPRLRQLEFGDVLRRARERGDLLAGLMRSITPPRGNRP